MIQASSRRNGRNEKLDYSRFSRASSLAEIMAATPVMVGKMHWLCTTRRAEIWSRGPVLVFLPSLEEDRFYSWSELDAVARHRDSFMDGKCVCGSTWFMSGGDLVTMHSSTCRAAQLGELLGAAS